MHNVLIIFYIAFPIGNLFILPKLAYEPARLYLAGALYDYNGSEQARKIVEEGLLSANPYVNLQSIHILLNIDSDKVNALLPIIHKHIELYSEADTHISAEDFLEALLMRLGEHHTKSE